MIGCVSIQKKNEKKKKKRTAADENRCWKINENKQAFGLLAYYLLVKDRGDKVLNFIEKVLYYTAIVWYNNTIIRRKTDDE